MEMKKKSVISFLLILSFLTALVPSAFAADNRHEIRGSYTYFPTLGILGVLDNQTETFTYCDDWFLGNGYDITKDLALISLNFTQASFGKAFVPEDRGYENQKEFLTKCGFEGYDCNYYFKNQSEFDSMAVGCAHKKLSDGSTLLAVGTRGHNYLKEWAGNVNGGTEGDWKGFRLCADQILDFTKQYIADQKITGEIRIWMVGYSRSAISVNLAAGDLDRGYDLGDVTLPRENMFVYVFESPEGSSATDCHDRIFNNIHNFYNPADIVGYVPMDFWGMDHFGEDILLPAAHTDPDYAARRDVMFRELATIPLGPLYLIDTFQMLSLDPARNVPAGPDKITQVEYYDMLVEMLKKVVPTRADFQPYMADIEELLGTILGNSGPEWGQALQTLGRDLAANAVPIVQAGLAGEEPLLDALGNVFFNSLKSSGIAGYTLDEVKALLRNMIPLVVKLIRTDADIVLTLLGNIVTILNAHFTEIELAWLRTLPEEYLTGQQKGGPETESFVAPFRDVKSTAWYAGAVRDAYQKGLMTGIRSDRFDPQGTATRAMIVQILYARAGKPAGAAASGFTDIPSGAWYEDAVNWARAEGVAGGYPDRSFRPEEPVTREQLITILKADGGRNDARRGDLKGFADREEISGWALDAVGWGVAAGLIAGRDGNRIAPKAVATRAEVAQIMTNYTK